MNDKELEDRASRLSKQQEELQLAVKDMMIKWCEERGLSSSEMTGMLTMVSIATGAAAVHAAALSKNKAIMELAMGLVNDWFGKEMDALIEAISRG